jgi:hypothetical protein
MSMSHMLFASDLSDSTILCDIYLTAFADDIVYTRDLQAQFVLGRFKHVNIFSG